MRRWTGLRPVSYTHLVQPDIDYSNGLVDVLNIPHTTINIHDAVQGVLREMERVGLTPSRQTTVNLPSRVRMATLYAVAQTLDVYKRQHLAHARGTRAHPLPQQEGSRGAGAADGLSGRGSVRLLRHARHAQRRGRAGEVPEMCIRDRK